MKRVIVLHIVSAFIMVHTSIFAQNNLNGCYEIISDDGTHWGQFISLQDGIFHIHYSIGWAMLYDYKCYDSLALGTYQWVTPDFIEINSFPVEQLLYDNMVFHAYRDSSLHQDSLYVDIRIPYGSPNGGDIDIVIFEAKLTNSEEIMCKNGHAMAVLGRRSDIQDLEITFMPQVNDRYFNIGCKISPSGSFLGTVHISLGPFPIPEDANVAKFEFPNMDMCMFVRHNIRGEYVKVEHNKLIWRGYTYKKVRKCE